MDVFALTKHLQHSPEDEQSILIETSRPKLAILRANTPTERDFTRGCTRKFTTMWFLLTTASDRIEFNAEIFHTITPEAECEMSMSSTSGSLIRLQD